MFIIFCVGCAVMMGGIIAAVTACRNKEDGPMVLGLIAFCVGLFMFVIPIGTLFAFTSDDNNTDVICYHCETPNEHDATDCCKCGQPIKNTNINVHITDDNSMPMDPTPSTNHTGRFCTYCGNTVEIVHKFCSSCGEATGFAVPSVSP